MALGLLDRCCSAETITRFPAIYKMSQNRSDFNIKVKENTFCLCKSYYIDFIQIDFLDLVFECSLSFDYFVFHVRNYAQTRYV